MKEIEKKARMFESEEIGRIYLLVGLVSEWQKETGGSLDELLGYMESTFPKKEASA